MTFVPTHRKAGIFNMDDAKRVLFLTRDILTRKNVTFYLLFGTCLGAVREHGLIPWDYDIDIGIYDDRFYEIRDEFVKAGYTLKTRGKDVFKYMPMIKDGVLVDIHPYKQEEEKMVTYIKDTRSWLSYPAVFKNLEQIEMYGTQWNVPSPVEDYLEWTYGDWRTPSELSATER